MTRALRLEYSGARACAQATRQLDALSWCFRSKQQAS